MENDMQLAAKKLNVQIIRKIENVNIHIGKYNKELVAILQYQPDKIFNEKKANEAEMLKFLDHKNIQNLINYTVIDDAYFFCVSFMDLGSVKHVISTAYPKGLPEQAIIVIIRQLLEALIYIHENKIIHRSVKCSHILLNSNGLARLGSFHHAVHVQKCNRWIGIDSQIHSFDETLEESFSWLAPEILRQDISGYSYNSDVYSIGITVCEMGNGFPPFEEMEPLQILYEKLRGSTPFLLDAQTNPQNSDKEKIPLHVFSSELHDLVQKCLIFQPMDRPTSTQLLEHPSLRLNKIKGTLKEVLPALVPL